MYSAGSIPAFAGPREGSALSGEALEELLKPIGCFVWISKPQDPSTDALPSALDLKGCRKDNWPQLVSMRDLLSLAQIQMNCFNIMEYIKWSDSFLSQDIKEA